MDSESRAIVGMYIGVAKLFPIGVLVRGAQPSDCGNRCRSCAVCYTDFGEAYAEVLPSKRHRAVGKDSGKTNHIEPFNCLTLEVRSPILVD